MNEYITGNRMRWPAQVCVDVGSFVHDIIRAKNVKCVWCKTDYIRALFHALKERSRPLVVISSNSDISIDSTYSDIIPDCVTAWYAVNLIEPVQRVVPMPLGLENLRSPGYSGNIGKIGMQTDRKTEKQLFCLMNFNPKTNPDREKIIKLFQDTPWVVDTEYGTPFEVVMRQTRDSVFVFCPEGHGPDTHRMSETIYMDSIPICKRTYLTEQYAHDCPVVLVDDWEEVTREMLEQKQIELASKKYTYDFMRFKQWQKKIKDLLR